MANTIFKLFSKGCLIPILLIVTAPYLFPIYVSLISLLFVFKVLKKLHNYLVKEPLLLADTLCSVESKIKFEEKPQRTPDRLIPYKNCLIEVFPKEKVYRIFTPKGVDLGINYKTLTEAKEEINLVI